MGGDIAQDIRASNARQLPDFRRAVPAPGRRRNRNIHGRRVDLGVGLCFGHPKLLGCHNDAYGAIPG